MIHWEAKRVPRWTAAVMNALRFTGASVDALEALDEAGWEHVLGFCDLQQLTLVVGALGARAPEPVKRRLDHNLAQNTERLARLTAAYHEIADAFEAASVEFLLLKGPAQWPRFISELRLRMHHDIDLLCPGESLLTGRDALSSLGYKAIEGLEQFPTDHLPVMVRDTGWRWNGNLFDPEIPPAVDLHFRLWDRATEAFDAPGVERFWDRRVLEPRAGRPMPMLHT